LPGTGFAIFFSSATSASVAALMPLISSAWLAPAVRYFMPSSQIAWASRVAVVVPSPAASDVLLAASRTSLAPMFS
jgi:hypothetical protein